MSVKTTKHTFGNLLLGYLATVALDENGDSYIDQRWNIGIRCFHKTNADVAKLVDGCWMGISLLNESSAARTKIIMTENLVLHLVVSPQPGQAIWVHDAEDFALCILPADVVLVPAV